MSSVDWIPGVSQIKSTIQLISGDVEGAAKTQINFFQECPVLSQATSGVQLLTGDVDGAIETQMRCLGIVNNITNAIPVVGHIKGVIHHAVGDYEGGNQALNAANRTAVVLGSGAIMGIATGLVGAIDAGITAGTAYDTIDSLISEKPKEVIASVNAVINKPDEENIFNTTAAFMNDGLVNNLKLSRAARADQLNAAIFPEDGGASSSMTSGQIVSLAEDINALTSEINSIQHKPPTFWNDPNAQIVANRVKQITLPKCKNVYTTLISFWKLYEKAIPELETIMMKIILKYPESAVYLKAIVHASSYQMAENATKQLEALLNQLKEKLPELYDEIKGLLDEGEILIESSGKQ